jgi:hypothetical protein
MQMGSILTPALDAIRAMNVKETARTWHGPNGGECANTLDTLPVIVRYELTDDLRGNEIAEVTEVLICGHAISASDFADDIRAEWGRQCMTARGGL